VAAVWTITAVRRHGDPPHGHGVGPRRSGMWTWPVGVGVMADPFERGWLWLSRRNRGGIQAEEQGPRSRVIRK